MIQLSKNDEWPPVTIIGHSSFGSCLPRISSEVNCRKNLRNFWPSNLVVMMKNLQTCDSQMKTHYVHLGTHTINKKLHYINFFHFIYVYNHISIVCILSILLLLNPLFRNFQINIVPAKPFFAISFRKHTSRQLCL